MAATPYHFSTATGDQTVIDAAIPSVLWGWNVTETAGSAAEVVFRTSSASGPVLARVTLAAGESAGTEYPFGIDAGQGIYIDRVSGTTEVVVYVSRA